MTVFVFQINFRKYKNKDIGKYKNKNINVIFVHFLS